MNRKLGFQALVFHIADAVKALPNKGQLKRKLILKPLKKRLTKKQRKQLEKIVSKKKKKAMVGVTVTGDT